MPTLVQKAFNGQVGALPGATLTVNISAGGTGNLICGSVTYADGATLSNVKDNNGVTYNIVDTIHDVPNSTFLSTFYLPNISGAPTSLIATFSVAGGAFVNIQMQEWSGIATATPLDGHNMATAASAATVVSPNITTTAAGDLIYGCLVNDSGAVGAYGATSPFTLQNADNTNGLGADESQIQSATGTVQASFGNNINQACIVGVMAFKAAAAGVVENYAAFKGRTFPPQWNLSAALFRGAAQDTSSLGVETNPHWRGRAWAAQWSPLRALMQNSDSNVPFAQSETNTFFIPRMRPAAWNPLPLARTTAQDFSSFGVETNPHWVGRPWPVIWKPLVALNRVPAADVPFVAVDAPVYFLLRTWPLQWQLNRALGRNTANDFSSLAVETNQFFQPRTWATR